MVTGVQTCALPIFDGLADGSVLECSADREPEVFKAAQVSLGALGVISTWDGYRVRVGQVEDVVRTLSAEGWTIEIDAARVRVADDFDVEISSGIDWFDLNVNASFDDVRIGLPELLAAADANRSLLRLPDGTYGVIPSSWAGSLAPVLDLGKREGEGVRFRTSQALLIDALLQGKRRTVDDAFAELRQRVAEARPEPQQEPSKIGRAHV